MFYNNRNKAMSCLLLLILLTIAFFPSFNRTNAEALQNNELKALLQNTVGKVYFVATSGDDNNPGTEEKPFRHIQYAAEIVHAGDTCIVRGGIYRETVIPLFDGEYDKPILFAAYPRENVTISGADLLEGNWDVYKSGIYKTNTNLDFNQLFVDGRMMNEARWPNAEVDRLVFMPRAKAGYGTDRVKLCDSNLPSGDWNGATVHIWPGDSWFVFTRTVTEYKGKKELSFDQSLSFLDDNNNPDDKTYKPKPGNYYYLSGSLAGLDIPTEWVLDKASNQIYLWVPEGNSPNMHQVEVKQRDYAFKIIKKDYIHICGFNIFAAAIMIKGSNYCQIDSCHQKYVEHFTKIEPKMAWDDYYCGNLINGFNNEWRNSSIAYSAGNGIRITKGSNYVKISNCIIHDINYSGCEFAPINTLNSRRGLIIVDHNTIYNAGRNLIFHNNTESIQITYNELYNGGLLCSDCGGTYCWETDGSSSLIAYNWIHDIHDIVADFAVGIYFDNFSHGITTHHNVVWNTTIGVRISNDVLDNLVVNNTILKSRKKSFATWIPPGRQPNQKGTMIVNNLYTGQVEYVKGQNAPIQHHNGNYKIDEKFVPTIDSKAIDAGVEVKGITDSFSGKAPDIGAYEYGGIYWKPGANWIELLKYNGW